MKPGCEEAIHRAIVDYLRTVLVDAKVVHIPNNPRSKVAGGRLKALGMVKGAPDLMILRRGVCRFIEVKTAKGVLTAEQKDFRDWCFSAGFQWAICRSVEQVRVTLAMWQIPTREAA